MSCDDFGGGGAGLITGIPASSTDNAIVRWDGTGGDTLQNSGVLIDDSDNVTGIVDLTVTGNFNFGNAAVDTMTVDGTMQIDNNNYIQFEGIASDPDNFQISCDASGHALLENTTSGGNINLWTTGQGLVRIAQGDGLLLTDNIALRLGSSEDAGIAFNTFQVADALTIQPDATSNNLLIFQLGDGATDFGHAAQTNPTIFLHSADATDTTQWMSFVHDQTDGVIDAGTGAVKIGTQTLSFDDEDINIGGGVHGTIGASCLAVGFDAVASGDNSTAIGHSTDATGLDSTCVGTSAQATSQGAIAIGKSATASTAIGPIAIGLSVTANQQNAVAIGRSATASGTSATALGNAATASSSGALALGQNSNCGAANSAALGQNSSATSTGTLALGTGATAGHNRSICIGQNSASTAAFQCIIGGAGTGPESIYIGDGVTHTAPNSELVITSCGGDGTDVAATTVIVAAGKNTGSSTSSQVKIQTPDAGGSGTTLQTLVDRMVFHTDGDIDFEHAYSLHTESFGAGANSITGDATLVLKTAITGGGDTMTLPAVSTVKAGTMIVVKDAAGGAGTDNITIDGNGAETIDGALTQVISQNYGAITLVTDGSNWFII